MDKIVNYIDRYLHAFLLLPVYYIFLYTMIGMNVGEEGKGPDYGAGFVISGVLSILTLLLTTIRMRIKKDYSKTEYVVILCLIFVPFFLFNYLYYR